MSNDSSMNMDDTMTSEASMDNSMNDTIDAME